MVTQENKKRRLIESWDAKVNNGLTLSVVTQPLFAVNGMRHVPETQFIAMSRLPL